MHTFTLPPFYYGDFCVFETLNLTLEQGWTALIGPSGAGKSTLLNALAKKNSAFMPQDDPLIPWMTTLQNITLGDTLRGKKPPTQKAGSMLHDFGLGDKAGSYPEALSGGMKQRASLMRTLYEDRDLILLDEPFSKLDIKTKKHTHTMAKQFSRQKSVLFVSHDLQDVLALADRVLILKGSPATLTPMAKADFESLTLHDFQRLMESDA